MLKHKRLILVPVLIFLFAFSACDKDDNKIPPTTTTKKEVIKTTVETTRTKRTITETTTKSAQNKYNKNSKNKTSAVGETIASSSNSPNIVQYSTNEEVVNYYNSCINKVKSKSKTVIRNYEEILTLENNLNNGEITSTLISSYFNKGRDTSALVCSTYDEKIANFPVAGNNYSSKLEPYMVKSASCTYKNGNYNIVIYLKDDTEGQNYSSTCLSVVSTDWVSNTCNEIIEKDKMSLACKNCVIKCTINSSTGNVLYLNTYMPTVVTLTAFEEDQSFSFYIKQDWTISW